MLFLLYAINWLGDFGPIGRRQGQTIFEKECMEQKTLWSGPGCHQG